MRKYDLWSKRMHCWVQRLCLWFVNKLAQSVFLWFAKKLVCVSFLLATECILCTLGMFLLHAIKLLCITKSTGGSMQWPMERRILCSARNVCVIIDGCPMEHGQGRLSAVLWNRPTLFNRVSTRDQVVGGRGVVATTVQMVLLRV